MRAPLLRRALTRSFTLVELMVVVAIIGLLAAVVTINLVGQGDKARVERVKADMKSIKQAIKLYKNDTGRWPTQLSDLWERPGGVKGWGPQPYLDSDSVPPLDPWGVEYTYERGSGSDFGIISYGADGAPGGDGPEQDLDSRTINQQEDF